MLNSLADLANHRLWRIDAAADYGTLRGLARTRINTALVTSQWDANDGGARVKAASRAVAEPADPNTRRPARLEEAVLAEVALVDEVPTEGSEVVVRPDNGAGVSAESSWRKP